MDVITHELICAAFVGEASPAELKRLARWRAQSPENEAEYQKLRQLWDAAGELPEAQVPRPRPSTSALIERARAHVDVERDEAVAEFAGRPMKSEAGQKPTNKRRRFASPRVAAIAAALVVGLGLGTLFSQGPRDEGLAPRSVVTGPNQATTMTLGDGTVVQLAPESRIEFTETRQISEVTLEGRAYFAVPTRSDRAFRVQLPSGAVEVLGTRFDVQASQDEMQVVVVDGAVQMASRGGVVQVGASQVARSTASAPPEVEEVEDVYEIIGWLGGFLAFQATPMVRVAEEIERRLGIPIVISDPALLEHTVTGWFADDEPEKVIAGICRAVNARCIVDEEDRSIRMER